MLLICCLIYYDFNTSDMKKTFLTLMTNFCCCIVSIWLLIINQIDVLRCIIGPMPNLICKFLLFLKLFFTQVGLFAMDYIIICRYLMIFVFKNPAAFQVTEENQSVVFPVNRLRNYCV